MVVGNAGGGNGCGCVADAQAVEAVGDTANIAELDPVLVLSAAGGEILDGKCGGR